MNRLNNSDRCRVLACLVEGNSIRVTEDCGPYRKGELLWLDHNRAVPAKQEFHKPGSVFRWVKTNYRWE